MAKQPAPAERTELMVLAPSVGARANSATTLFVMGGKVLRACMGDASWYRCLWRERCSTRT